MGLKTLSVTGEIDHYEINIGSISDQYKITSFRRATYGAGTLLAIFLQMSSDNMSIISSWIWHLVLNRECMISYITVVFPTVEFLVTYQKQYPQKKLSKWRYVSIKWRKRMCI